MITELEINNIINNISDIKFYNTSYREYYGLINKYVITVYPFFFQIYEIINNNTNWINEYNNENITSVFYIHHIDFTKKLCSFDSCMIYEKVSGYQIHTKLHIKDNIDFGNEYFDNNKYRFAKYFKTHIRKEKIKNIL